MGDPQSLYIYIFALGEKNEGGPLEDRIEDDSNQQQG